MKNGLFIADISDVLAKHNVDITKIDIDIKNGLVKIRVEGEEMFEGLEDE